MKEDAESRAFDAWAEYYDIVHTGLPGEAEFYVGQAVRAGGPVLELGCGTGRICIPMAMSGVDVTGLEISKEMLARCRAKKRAAGKTPGRMTLIHGDMRDFEIDARFDLIVIPYRGFMHLLSPDDQLACLDAARRHLTDDGLLVLNVWLAKPSALHTHVGKTGGGQRFVGRYPMPGRECVLVHYCSCACEELRQLLCEEHMFHEVGPDGTVRRSRALSLVRTWFTPREMAALVHNAGLAVDGLFGDFDCGPLTPSSGEMIWALRRASGR